MSESSSLLKIGEIVEITMGRDAGKYAVVLEILSDRYVNIVDGDKRKYDNPKKKNIRHIRSTRNISKEVIKSLMEDNRVSNAKLRYVIQEYANNQISMDIKKGE